MWDADQPWSEWAALSEPMACLELRVVWRRMGARHVSDNPVYSDLRPLEADTWTLRQLETHPADGVSGDTSGFGSCAVGCASFNGCCCGLAAGDHCGAFASASAASFMAIKARWYFWRCVVP